MTPTDEKLLQHFSQFISDHKKNFIDRVLDQRTRYITVVLEDIFQSQNASAVLRTAECMGLQDVHIVENITKYSLNARVLKGADKWLDLHRHKEPGVNNTAICFQSLRDQGFRILVADPSEDGIPIDEVDVHAGKIALAFGNELRGVSDFAVANCDQKIRIPMYGFTESLNISVSVAICLNTILPKLRYSNTEIFLTETEKQQMRLRWYRKAVRKSDLLEKEFLKGIH